MRLFIVNNLLLYILVIMEDILLISLYYTDYVFLGNIVIVQLDTNLLIQILKKPVIL